MNDFLALTEKRRSCRSYDPAKDIPDSSLEYCLQAARMAPSACNRQPWHFYVVRDKERKHQLITKGLLPGIQHDWLNNAPCLVVLSVTPETVTHRLARFVSGIPYHFIDAGIAGEHFVLAAAEQNLGTCWIGWIHEKNIKKLLLFKKRQRVVAMIAAGYPADPDFFSSSRSTGRKELSDISS